MKPLTRRQLVMMPLTFLIGAVVAVLSGTIGRLIPARKPDPRMVMKLSMSSLYGKMGGPGSYYGGRAEWIQMPMSGIQRRIDLGHPYDYDFVSAYPRSGRNRPLG